MALATRFLSRLDDLWDRRTERLRRLVVRGGPGAPKKFSRDVRDKLTKQLLDAAVEVLVKKHAKKAFERLAVARRQKHIAGRGDDKRFNNMWKWARLNLRGPIVYAFWRGSNCLYVGKGAGPYRLGNYQRSVYIRDACSAPR
ncbi:MAG: hypothetical protein MN733_20545 [Nitrososphaera sp.]|nr:hypothetical protein [Nitrososphaera sp.]